jgi:hypothetical protein
VPHELLGKSETGVGSGTGRVEAIQRREGEPVVHGIIAKECNCATSGTREGGEKGLGWRGGEEQMEGESGGESEGMLLVCMDVHFPKNSL